MLSFQENTFLNIPTDIHLYWLKYLSFDELITISRVCRRLRFISRNDSFWHAKLQKHFGTSLVSDQKSTWFDTFDTQTLIQYPKMSKNQRKMFYNVIENDLAALKKLIETKKITIYDFIKLKDKTGLNCLDYLHKIQAQAILDYIFSQALNYFVSNSKLDQLRIDSIEWCLTHWAVATNQCETDIIDYLDQITSNQTNYDNANKVFKELSPVHIASEYGLVSILEALRQYNFTVEQRAIRFEKDYETRMAPLHLAARKGHLNIVTALLKSGVSVNSLATELPPKSWILTNENIKPIHYASANNHIEIVKIFIKNGASAFDEDAYKQSPLQYAAASGYDDLFQLLIEQDPGSSDISSSLNRALFYAVDNRHYHFIQPLLAKGARPDWKNTNSDYELKDRTATDLAIEHQSEEALRALLGEISNHAISSKYQPASYGTVWFHVGCISGLFFLGLPGLFIMPYLVNKWKIGNGFAVFLFPIIAILLGTLIGGLIGYAIGKKVEKNAAQNAHTFIRNITSPALSIQVDPIKNGDDEEIAKQEAHTNLSSDRTPRHSSPVQTLKGYLPLTFLSNTNAEQRRREDLEQGLQINEDPEQVDEKLHALRGVAQVIAPRAIHFPPVPQHEPLPAAAPVKQLSSQRSKLATG